LVHINDFPMKNHSIPLWEELGVSPVRCHSSLPWKKD
jgi:hypothetical protein